jgi:hypothetical protein
MVTQMLRQSDAEVFKLYSQAKLGMMREALAKLDRQANERGISGTANVNWTIFCTLSCTVVVSLRFRKGGQIDSKGVNGGRAGTRTPDLLRVKQAL